MYTYTMRSRARELHRKYTLPILPNLILNAVQMQKEMCCPQAKVTDNAT